MESVPGARRALTPKLAQKVDQSRQEALAEACH